jgi:uncharacterized protein (DUF433 family)
MDDSISQRIVRNPGICGGRACIAGHRVRVLDIVAWHEFLGMTPDQIVTQVPSISLADVHAALAYYFDHMPEIQEEIRAEHALADLLLANQESPLKAKLHRQAS